MKKPKILILAAAVNGLVGASIQVANAATSKDEKIELLERRLRLLEQRLEESETRKPAAVKAADTESPAVKQLDQKVKVLERKLEVEKEVAETAKKSAPKLEAGSSGFRITSADGDHQLRLRGFAQADGNFFMDDSTGDAKGLVNGVGIGADKFTIRRARLQFDGTLWKYADFRFAPDFGGGQARIFDAYLDLHYFPFASLTAGKQKGPVSLERLQSATALTFAERAYPTQLAPNRDLGVMVHGEFAWPGYSNQYGGPHNFNDFLSYQVGVFNGARDNGFIDTDTDDNKEFEGRIFAHPFQHAGIPALEGLGIGVAGTWGQPTQNSLPSLVSPGQQKIVTYTDKSVTNGVVDGTKVVNTTTTTLATADKDHYRIYPQAYWYWGSFGLLGEYVLSSQGLNGSIADTTGKVTTPVKSVDIRQNNTAWQVAASYVLTGEDNTFQGVRPRQAFNPFNGNWGALQLAARWSELDIDDKTFKNYGTSATPVYLYADPNKSVSKATSWAVGANWYLNNNVKLMADYEQTHFDGGAQNAKGRLIDRPTEKVFFTRFQVAY